MSALRKINTSFGGKFVSTKYRTLAKSYANWVAYEEDGYLYSKFYFLFQVDDFFPVKGKSNHQFFKILTLNIKPYICFRVKLFI